MSLPLNMEITHQQAWASRAQMRELNVIPHPLYFAQQLHEIPDQSKTANGISYYPVLKPEPATLQREITSARTMRAAQIRHKDSITCQF